MKGPHWVLFEWVARIAEGEIVTLLARSTPDWPDYLLRPQIRRDGMLGVRRQFHHQRRIPRPLPVREAPPLPVITFTVRNDTYLRITSLRMRPKDETVWGTNLLAAHPVQAKETYSLTFTAGFYDIRIMDYHDGIIYEANDVPIGAEPGSQHGRPRRPILGRVSTVRRRSTFAGSILNTPPAAITRISRSRGTEGSLPEKTSPWKLRPVYIPPFRTAAPENFITGSAASTSAPPAAVPTIYSGDSGAALCRPPNSCRKFPAGIAFSVLRRPGIAGVPSAAGPRVSKPGRLQEITGAADIHTGKNSPFIPPVSRGGHP